MTACEICGGIGFTIVSREGREFAQRCACRRASGATGDALGLSRERVRQIERETMAKLRDPQRADALRDYLA